MADPSGEIDLDSVIDRLLEGKPSHFPTFVLSSLDSATSCRPRRLLISYRLTLSSPLSRPPSSASSRSGSLFFFFFQIIFVIHVSIRSSPISYIFVDFVTVRGNRPGKPVQLQEHEIKYLCTKAREIFINQPILLELEAPIKICGTQDTHYLLLAGRYMWMSSRSLMTNSLPSLFLPF